MKDEPIHLELFVGSLGSSTVFERQEQYLDRLERLRTAGAIDSYGVTVWGDGIVPGSNSAHSSPGRDIVHRLLLLRQWCHLNDADANELFQRPSQIGTADRVRPVELMPLVLCEFRGTRLQFATPYADDTRSVAVREHLDALDGQSGRRLVSRSDAVTIEDPVRTAQLNARPREGPREENTTNEQTHLNG